MRQNFKVEMKNRTDFSEKNTEEMLEMFQHISFLWMPKRHPIYQNGHDSPQISKPYVNTGEIS